MTTSTSKMKLPPLPTPLPTPDTLTLETLQNLISHYDPLLAHIQKTSAPPSKRQIGAPNTPIDLPSLDTLRHVTIPAAIANREKEGKYLELLELRQLMDWKLTRGKSRPTLRALIASNTAHLVKGVTTSAFQLLSSSHSSPSQEQITKALDALSTLRGVGPATASLLASVARPDLVPFFSDELFVWTTGRLAKGLKYNRKEYEELFAVVKEVRERLGDSVSAGEVEKVAFVVEKVRAGVGYVVGEEDGEGEDDDNGQEEEHEKKKKKGLKRPASEEQGEKASASKKRTRKG